MGCGSSKQFEQNAIKIAPSFDISLAKKVIYNNKNQDYLEFYKDILDELYDMRTKIIKILNLKIEKFRKIKWELDEFQEFLQRQKLEQKKEFDQAFLREFSELNSQIRSPG